MEPTRRGDPGIAAVLDDAVDPPVGRRADRGRVTGSAPDTVARLLREQGFSLQANAKTIEGGQHPDRDAQFSYLNDQAGAAPGRG